MTDTTPTPPGFPRWWFWYAFAVSLLTLVALGIAVNGILENNRQDDRQTAFINCLDDYVSSLATSLPQVRDAAAKHDQALTEHVAAVEEWAKDWTALIVAANEGRQPTEADVDDLLTDAQNLADASERRILAYRALTKARLDNPLPTPGDFCG
jgi:hypothetical protein